MVYLRVALLGLVLFARLLRTTSTHLVVTFILSAFLALLFVFCGLLGFHLVLHDDRNTPVPGCVGILSIHQTLIGKSAYLFDLILPQSGLRHDAPRRIRPVG